MTLVVNDSPYEFEGETLVDLLAVLEKPTQGVAVAINQNIVPKSQWAVTELTEQSQVFIFESIAGG